MDDLIRQGIYLLRGMWQRRWIGLAIAWLVGVGAAVAILRIPDKYEASARVYVDTQSILKPLMAGIAIQPNVEQQVTMLSRTLISRPNVEKLVRMADLDLQTRSKQDHEKLVDGLMSSLVIGRAGGDNLYVLAYRDQEPDKAKRVLQSLVSIFVESNLGSKRKDTDAAKKFIDDQIKVYEAKLRDGENRLKEFKLKHMNLASADGKDYYGRINEVGIALEQARLDYREAVNSRDALKRQIEGEEPIFLPDPADNTQQTAVVPELDARIDAAKRNLDAIRLKYTDAHPDVVGTNRLIEELESQRAREIAARRAASSTTKATRTPINSNPVYQQLKVSLGEAEANVASLQARVAEYEQRYSVLKQSAKMAPDVEAEFTQLNRDYDVNKRNYDALVSRRESAEISGEMEAASGVADFRLIDPPRVSPQPVAPNRLVLFPLAFFGAIAAGLLAALAASQIWPTFLDARAVREATGLPVLGTVSLLANEESKRKQRRGIFAFISAFIALLGTFGGAMLLLFLHTARTV